jgi:Kef-type K+ transport system membrane component KefB
MSAHEPSKSLLAPASRVRTLAVYAAMIGLGAAAYMLIRSQGEGLVAEGAPTAPAVGGEAHSNLLANVLLALAAITLLARFVGGLFRRYLGQPPVIGEILAGIMLGPSVLGAISPAAYEMLLPSGAASYLGLISKVGVVLFMFLVGLDLDPRLLRGNTHVTVAVSHASIFAPFLLGTTLALWLYPRFSTSNVSFTVFSLFFGVSMSVTAFPVLARILTDRRVQQTRLGVTALTCAAVDDVSAWTLLALIVGIASSSLSGAVRTVPLVVAYVAVMLLIVRPLVTPLVARIQESKEPLSRSVLAAIFVALLMSAFVTELIGIHALFGAFLLGAIMPHDGRLAEQLRARLEDIVVVLFLPIFFAFSGMRTQIGLVHGGEAWLACGAILLVATLGKFGGTFVAARVTGMSWRHSSALGILMNTRGLMELIVLNLGLDLGVITPTMFTMLIIMALVTTFATTPILDLILGKRGFADDPLPHTQTPTRLEH